MFYCLSWVTKFISTLLQRSCHVWFNGSTTNCSQLFTPDSLYSTIVHCRFSCSLSYLNLQLHLANQKPLLMSWSCWPDMKTTTYHTIFGMLPKHISWSFGFTMGIWFHYMCQQNTNHVLTKSISHLGQDFLSAIVFSCLVFSLFPDRYLCEISPSNFINLLFYFSNSPPV